MLFESLESKRSTGRQIVTTSCSKTFLHFNPKTLNLRSNSDKYWCCPRSRSTCNKCTHYISPVIKTQRNIRVLSADLSVLELTIQPKRQFDKLGVKLKNFCFHGKTRRSILFFGCFVCRTVNKQSRSGLFYRPYWKDREISNRLGQMELKRTLFQLWPAFSLFPLWAMVTPIFHESAKVADF